MFRWLRGWHLERKREREREKKKRKREREREKVPAASEWQGKTEIANARIILWSNSFEGNSTVASKKKLPSPVLNPPPGPPNACHASSGCQEVERFNEMVVKSPAAA